MRTLLISCAAVAVLALAAGCSDREEAPPSSPTTTAAATGTTAAPSSPTPAATPTPTVPPAQRLAQSPKYFIYVVGTGDTVASIADMFDGVTGSTDADFEAELRQVNSITSNSLPVGQEIAIPLRLPTAASLFQDNTIAEKLAAGTGGTTVPFLVPSTGLRDGLRGLFTLYRLELEDGDGQGERQGFIATYAQLDRVGVKAGELDGEARVQGPMFAVAGGSLVDRFVAEHKDAYQWRVNNVSYATAVLARGLTLTPQAISGGMVAGQ